MKSTENNYSWEGKRNDESEPEELPGFPRVLTTRDGKRLTALFIIFQYYRCHWPFHCWKGFFVFEKKFIYNGGDSDEEDCFLWQRWYW